MAVVVLVVGLAFWAQKRRREVRRELGASVLLITVDTLRADALGCYGHANAQTPWMDRLASSGVRFDFAHAHNVVTLPSHANILSGRYPMEHGVRDNSGFRFPREMDTLATLLQSRGYATGAFVSAFPLDSRFGLDRGFDVYDDSFVDARVRPAFLMQERRGPETVELARRWLALQGQRPSFAWVHLYEPHYPYEPDEPWASRFRDHPYEGEVAATDAALQPLLEPLVNQGREARTLVVLTSDHGESLGEHGEATHGIFAYEATLRVPLILYQPRQLGQRVVAAPARHVDILPTILDALALPVPPGLPGRSLLPLAQGEDAPETTTYFEALSGQLDRGWAPLHGVIRGFTKYIDLPLPELYLLKTDPRETHDLVAAEPQRVSALRTLLAPFLSEDKGATRGRESAETRERLRSLGYLTVGASPKTEYTAEDDPKRLIALDAMLQEVVGLYSAGDLRSALARCRELVRLRPTMAVSLLHLAHLEREGGDLPAAIAALRQAVALQPDDMVTLSLLGAYLTQAGQAREAAALLEAPARGATPDVDLVIARSLALARIGRAQEALAALAKAREVDSTNPMVLVTAGTVHLMAGDPKSAREAFEAALRLNPKVARAQSSLGMLAGEAGQTEEALAHFQAAVALDPREHAKLVPLGLLLWQRGRPAEGRRYLELFVASAPPALYARDLERVRSWLAGSAPPGR